MKRTRVVPFGPWLAAVVCCLPLLVAALPRPQTTETPAPPSRQIAYLVFGDDDGATAGGDIWLVYEDGTDARQLTDTGRDCCLAWSADGTRLFFARQADVPPEQPQYFTLMHHDFSAGAVREVSPILEGSASSLAASVDGALLAYTTNRPMSPEPYGLLDNRGCLHTFNLTTGETVTIDCVAEGFLREPEFNPHEPRIVVGVSGFEAAVIAAYDLSPSEPSFYQDACCFSPQLAANDIRLYAIGTEYYIPTTFEQQGLNGSIGIFEYGQGLQGASPVVVGNDPLGQLDLSPEENRLAYTRNGTIEIVEIWTGNPPRAVVAGSDPTWRPGIAADPATATPPPSPTPPPPTATAEPATATAAPTADDTTAAAGAGPTADAPAPAAADATAPDEASAPPSWLGPARAVVLGVMVVSGGAFVVGLAALALRRRGG